MLKCRLSWISSHRLLYGASVGTAWAELAVIVNPNNVYTLTVAEVARFFPKHYREFPDGERALPVNQPETPMSRETFDPVVMGKSPNQMKACRGQIIFTGKSDAPREGADDSSLRQAVVVERGSIGSIDEAHVNGSVRVLQVLPDEYP